MGQVLSTCIKEMSRIFHNLISTLRLHTSQSPSSSNGDNKPPPLLQPAMEGDLVTIQKLTAPFLEDTNNGDVNLSLQSYVNKLDPAQNAAIHGAAYAGHLEVVKYLVEECHADILGKNNLECSPIWLAAGYGHKDCVHYLLSQIEKQVPQKWKEHVFYNENSTGDSPLLASASKGHDEICQVLLEASIMTKDDENKNNDTYAVTKYLLSKENKNGDTPLTVTVSNSKEEDDCIKLVATLLKYNDLTISKDKTTTDSILNRKNKKGLTPLLIACERNLPKVITNLLETWNAEFLPDEEGNTPLAIASFCGNMEAVEALLKCLLSLDKQNSQIDIPNHNGCTPLWLACRTGNAKMVKLLLDAGADASMKNGENLTCLEVAKKFEKEKVVEILTLNN